jgi:RNA polymerase sigma factor (sigma-70 family)
MPTGQPDSVIRHLRRATLLQGDSGMTDGQLLDCFIADRDEAAFAALVRRHGPMVLSVCRRVLRHTQDAEDAFQAAFLVLARKAASVMPRNLVGNWLYGVAYRAALEAKAARRTRERQENAMPEPAAVEGADVWCELRPLLDQELSRLPERNRAAVVLCDLEGKTRREAARHLGIPEGTLSGRLTTARRKLAERLARRGLSLSGGVLAAFLSQEAAAANLPASLAIATTRAVTGVTAGSEVASVVSAEVAALTEGVQKTMLLSKLKGISAMFLACLVFGGTLLLTVRASAAPQGEGKPAKAQEQPAARAQPPMPPAAQAPPIQFVETDMIHAAAFTPDSRLLAGGGADRKVRIWDVRDHKLKQTLEGARRIVRCVKFSPDGKTLAASADDGGIYLWDIGGGKLETELQVELPRKPTPGLGPLSDQVGVNSLVFLPGGKLAAVYNYLHNTNTYHGRIVLWDVRGKKGETLYDGPGHMYSLALSPDGTLLAATIAWSSDSNGFKVWDLKRREVVWQEKVKEDFMSAVLWSPDGKHLAVGGGRSVNVGQGVRSEGRLWMFDVKTRKQLWDSHEPGNWAYSRITFTADGKGLLTASSGREVPFRRKGLTGTTVLSDLRRWDTATGKVVWKNEEAEGDYHGLAMSADGKTVAGSTSARLMLFDPETGALRKVLSKTTQGLWLGDDK